MTPISEDLIILCAHIGYSCHLLLHIKTPQGIEALKNNTCPPHKSAIWAGFGGAILSLPVWHRLEQLAGWEPESCVVSPQGFPGKEVSGFLSCLPRTPKVCVERKIPVEETELSFRTYLRNS